MNLGNEAQRFGRGETIDVKGLDAAIDFTTPDAGAVNVRTCLEQGVPCVQVPDAVARRLSGVAADRTADEGITICAETISELRQIPGLAGVHVMAVGNEHRVPVILQRAGLRMRSAAMTSEMPDARAGLAPARADGRGSADTESGVRTVTGGLPDARAGRRLARADGRGAPGGEAPRSGGPGVTPRDTHAR